MLPPVFAPERRARFETSGWKLKSGNTAVLVMGDVALLAHPVMPTVDEDGRLTPPPQGKGAASVQSRAFLKSRP